MTNKSLSYKPITLECDEIAAGNAYYQAALLLDIASRQATREKDLEAIMSLAELWIGLGKIMVSDENHEVEDRPRADFGFRDKSVIEKAEEKEEEDAS